MDPAVLGQKLRLFHALEVHQVALYQTQASLARQEADKHLFSRVAEIEAGHVENLEDALDMRGFNTRFLLRPIVEGTGYTLGALMGFSLQATLRANIAIENLAMKHYLRFIEECDEEPVRDLLWSNLMDESLHNEWFKNRLQHDIDKLPST